jgi:TonB family C-terminal domain
MNMKTKFVTAVTAILLTYSGVSAQKQITFSEPEITGVAYVTGDEINLRKLPSAKSPRLCFQQEAEDYEGTGAAVWSDMPVTQGCERRSAKLYKTNVIPVVQAADGWVQTIYSNMTPWVKENYCQIASLQQVRPGMSDRFDNRPLSIRTGGAYENWCACYWDDEMGGTGIYLGRVVGKIAVLPLLLNCYPVFDANVKGITVADGDIRYGYDAYVDNGRPVINLDKLSDSDFYKLLTLAEPSQEEQVFYAFDETIFRESICPDGYTGKIRVEKIEIPEFRESQEGKVYEVAEVAPSFPGGPVAMMQWLGQNIKYPDYAQYKKIQGRVLVKFVVRSDGSIDKVQIAKSVEESLDKEAARLVKAMPEWNPGMIGGKPVDVWFTLPISFKLSI